MQEHPEMDVTLEALIRAANRPAAESERLTMLLLETCWPGGHRDRTEPLSRGWLRLWGPEPIRMMVVRPVCGCHRGRGRCTICN
jgi:hypothetical protein